jgi:predicted double-glycine peptidase
MGSVSAPSAADDRRSVKSLLEIRQDRVVMQKWDISCGAAVLATLLTYQMGYPITEREVARAMIKRDEYLENPELIRARQGFSLLDMRRYVAQLGIRGTGYGQMTVDDLINKAPVAVPLSLRGYNHFVIFRGIRGNRVLLADPAWGNRTMLLEQFEAAWIDYPRLGKVGFVVLAPDGSQPPNRLASKATDFVALY